MRPLHSQESLQETVLGLLPFCVCHGESFVSTDFMSGDKFENHSRDTVIPIAVIVYVAVYVVQSVQTSVLCSFVQTVHLRYSDHVSLVHHALHSFIICSLFSQLVRHAAT